MPPAPGVWALILLQYNVLVRAPGVLRGDSRGARNPANRDKIRYAFNRDERFIPPERVGVDCLNIGKA